MGSSEISTARIAILVFPFAAQHLFDWTSKVSQVVTSVAARTFVVSGGIPDAVVWPDGVTVRDVGVRLHYLRERKPTWLSALLWIGKALAAQVLMAVEVFKLRDQIDGIFCAMGIYYQLPILVARLLNKKVLSASMGLYALKAKLSYGEVMAAFTSLLTRLSFALSHLVIVESFQLGTYKDLVPFHSKLCNGALFLEAPERFGITVPVSRREEQIGFIGRLVEEKGILDFIRAIPLVLEHRPALQILIVGTGILDPTVETALADQPWASHVRWIRRVDHAQIPEVMNQLKLLVVPSSDEGLPNIILEAMGCGTPVLATAAGGIPDLVIHEETGFMLTDKSPEALAQAITQALSHPNLERITARAKAYTAENYSLESARQRYKAILDRMVGDAAIQA